MSERGAEYEDAPPARPIAPIRQGTSHPLHVRKLIAMAVDTRRDRKERIHEIARRFGVDRKTARMYHRWWQADGKPEYEDDSEVRASVLKPMARRVFEDGTYTAAERRTRGEEKFGSDQKWRDIAAKIAKIQADVAPAFTASDIAGFVNRNGEGAPESMKEHFAKLKGECGAVQLDERDVQEARKLAGLTYKKIAYDYKDREVRDVVAKKKAFVEIQRHLFAEDCVFVDEFSVVMNAVPTRGWGRKGEMPYVRKREQTDSRTTVIAAMRWPSSNAANMNLPPAMFLRIFPPIPSRISNNYPAVNAVQDRDAERLRSQKWWEGFVLVMGDWCKKKDGGRDRVRLASLRSAMEAMARPGSAMYDWVVKGQASIPFGMGARSDGSVIPEEFWKFPADGGAETLVKTAFARTAMWSDYWNHLPGRPIVDDVEHTDDPREKAAFVFRLAAHDFFLWAHVRMHNYMIDGAQFGERLSLGGTWMAGGDAALIVKNVLEGTRQRAEANLLKYDDTRGAFDDQDESEESISKMLRELRELFRESDYETIFSSLFETKTPDQERKFTHLHNLFFKETSMFYSRDYVDGYKNPSSTYDFLLAREIYRNLNLGFKKDGAANQQLGKWEVATHIWKMVHTYGGDKDRLLDPTLDSVRLDSTEQTGIPYTYGARGREDEFFNGDFFPDAFAKYLRDRGYAQIKKTRDRASRMSFARSQMRERYIGSTPMSVDAWLFKEFLVNLPDSFVVNKTIIMDGAAIHARPTDGEVRLNSDLPDALAVYPESELSPLAQLLRRRGAGDGVVLPPTKETFFEYAVDAQNRRTVQGLARRPALLYTPPYSPEFNPIELAFNPGKKFIRREVARHTRTRWNLSIAIINALNVLTRPHAIKNYMLCSGYRSKDIGVTPSLSRTMARRPDVANAGGVDAADAFYTNVQSKRTGACLGKMAEGKYPDPSKPPPRALKAVFHAIEKRDFETGETTYLCPSKETGDAKYRIKYDVQRDEQGEIRAVRCVRRGVKDYKQGDRVRVLWNGAWTRGTIEEVPEKNRDTRTDAKSEVTNNPWFSVKLVASGRVVRTMVSKIRPGEEKVRKRVESNEKRVDEIQTRNDRVIAKRVAEWTAQQRRAKDLQTGLGVSWRYTPAEALNAVQVAARRMQTHEDRVRESIAPAVRAWVDSNASDADVRVRRGPIGTRSRSAGDATPGGAEGTINAGAPSSSNAAYAPVQTGPVAAAIPRRDMARLPRVYAAFY